MINKIIDKIAHCGDLHFRATTRHEEFLQVCENFYKILKEQKIEHLVIAGDIFDSKTILSPEVIKIVYNFFNTLSTFLQVYVTVGNHDTNLTNKDRLCSIEPIIHFLKDNKNIHYYDKSGLYEISDNIVFGVFSILDNEKLFPIHIPNKDKNKTYIAIYHGALQGSKNDSEYEIESNAKWKDLFGEYSMAFCCDVHQRQFLDEHYIEKEIDENEIENYKNELGFEIIK